MEPEALLQLINQNHATTFRLVERYAVGERGAYAITSSESGRYVMKWHPDPVLLANYRQAAQVTAHLHEADYPAPRYVLTGVLGGISYSIQQELPGTPHQVKTTGLVSRLVELNRLQTSRASTQRRDWPAPVVDTVLFGGDGYCLLDPLRNCSATTAEILSAIQALVTKHADDEVEANDIVHFDFHQGNILVYEDAISGVIDWDGTCSGDCVFDLVTLLFYLYDRRDVRKLPWTEALERAGPGPLRIYLAHMILRQVDWSIRHYDSATVQKYVRRAEEILCDIGSI